MNVHGRVLLGGTPAYGGTLTWRRPSQTDALIDTRVSALGATQQRLYGISGGMVVVAVRSDGTFETRELRPGEWRVAWRSADSVSTPDRTLAIPDAAETQVVVEFTGGVIRGRVLDERDLPVPYARIREIEGPLFAFAGQDGSFTMTAVSPGVHRLQATLAAKASSVVEVTVETDRQTPDVTLRLDERQRNVVTIHVVGAGGEPKPSAFVFAEGPGGHLRILTADASGVASGTFADGLPEVAKLVAFADNAWAFGELRRAPREDEPSTTTIRFVRSGALRIRSRTTSGAPSIFSAQVPGDFSWMLGRIGTFVSLSPEEPLVIEGLPPGRYEVRLGSESGATIVTAGSTATIELR